MTKSNSNHEQGLKLHLSDAQREELVRFITENGHAKLDIDLLFEGNVSAKTIAPVAVLVGNAI
ncbi:hypothetical protein [Collimonas sp. OK412]|jgi:hypothetical protein|uniref:hypothetical protein n=1 Tax=Collimonas sp. (strain OK412) TaxID=1801619 RepID=UPI0008E82461|nr:hypothetical protein [Collimonas sp. OK412]SFC73552.1 hypothetical protein SAMN04515619_11284 [Collimonas sp. OK412]